ncbi:MAG TPA: hypothetical protein DCS43_08165 [Verrucomicrobia bacterium]|nr:hypothetical protein [Verrucomicrobiota bacterium]
MHTHRNGIIFDMDGVIADTEGVNARASIRVFAELFNLHGVKSSDFEAGIGRGAEAYMRAAAEANGFAMSDDDVQIAVAARQANLLSMFSNQSLPAFPGVLALMADALSSPDWAVAIATGSSLENTTAVLKAATVPYAQMTVITGSDPHARKPAPDIFLAAAYRMGIAPSRCVVIEDSVSGVQAAKAAGAVCIAVTNSFDASRLSQADLIVDCLSVISLATLTGLLAR